MFKNQLKRNLRTQRYTYFLIIRNNFDGIYETAPYELTIIAFFCSDKISQRCL